MSHSSRKTEPPSNSNSGSVDREHPVDGTASISTIVNVTIFISSRFAFGDTSTLCTLRANSFASSDEEGGDIDTLLALQSPPLMHSRQRSAMSALTGTIGQSLPHLATVGQW
jgi:hypothetical protein